MNLVTWDARARCRLLLAFAALPLLMAGSARGQLELRGDERREAMASIELEKRPLARRLLAHQELAVWLPEDWSELRRADNGTVTFSPDGGARQLHLGRFETQPGAGLIPILEEVLESLQSVGLLQEVESVRRLRVASRDALEVAGSGTADDPAGAARLLVIMDADRSHFRMLVLQGGAAGHETLDQALQRILRDFTPLDGSVWSPSFEQLRRSQVEGVAGMVWAERNRLFDAIARPAAIGQEWVSARLEALSGRDPRQLLDGLLHHHPRVRIGCVEALGQSSVGESVLAELLAAAILDSDPAVRFRVAGRAVVNRQLATAVLSRVLAIDSDLGRGAAFQLLAAAPESSRGELAVTAFEDRRQHPEASMPLVAAALAHWGAEEEAERLLTAAWKRARVTGLESAAWLELLRLRNPEALRAAGERLEAPLEKSPLPLSAAATSLAAFASLEEGTKRWDAAIAGLERALDEAPETEDLQTAVGILEELRDHLAVVTSMGPEADECAVLDRLEGSMVWVTARARDLGCEPEAPIVLARASVPRPGAYAFTLLDLVDRLEVGTPVQTQAFHVSLDRIDRLVEHWSGDPITMTSTGIDLGAPWQLEIWGGSVERGGGGPARLDSGATLRFSIVDRARFLDTLARVWVAELDLESLSLGILSSNALALLPAAMVAGWSEEQQLVSGTDSPDPPKPTNERTYLALSASRPWQDDEQRDLIELTLDDEGSHWEETRIFLHGEDAVLTHAMSPGEVVEKGAEADTESPESETATTRVELDLSGLIARYGAEEIPDSILELIEQGLSLSAGTRIDSESITTRFEIGGLSDEWLSFGHNVPVSEVRALNELLPASCFSWLGLSLDPSAVVELAESGSVPPLEELKPKRRRHVLDLVRAFEGEVGFAVLGVPDPRSGDAIEAWERRMVGYVAVEPEAADRFLKRVVRRGESHGDMRLFRAEDDLFARVGRFLVFGTDPEILATLGKGPFCASTPMAEQVAEDAPTTATLWAAWDTDRLADGLLQSIEAREAGEESSFLIEIFRSFGSMAAWARREDEGYRGEVVTRPRLQSEESMARVRRLAGHSELNWGSLRARGFPTRAIGAAPPTEVEVTLRVPDDLAGVTFDWRNERLDQEILDTGEYRFVSRPATALPEESDVRLPIRAPDLLPWMRNEAGLGVRTDEIQELAKSIRGEEEDPARIVRAIVEWAHESLDYTVIEGTESVERILATRKADCTEFTQLTIALARSLGIPARPVHGMFVGRHAAYGHRWAEVYLDRWYEIDPTWGVVQIPPTNLRLPLDDVAFLGSLPDARFVVNRVELDGGGWARRLSESELAGRQAALLAVDQERVLVGYSRGAGAEDGGYRILSSVDGGESFAEVRAPDDGRPVAALGGHGRLLWLERGSESARALEVYELSRGGGWEPVRLPPALASSDSWQLGVGGEGYLAVLEDSSRLLVLDRDLGAVRNVPLPDGARGEWLLAKEHGLLARTVEGADLSIHAWNGDGWETPIVIEETADLIALDLWRQGDVVEVLARHRQSGVIILLHLEPSVRTRGSVTAEMARSMSATTRTATGEWSVWVDGRDQILVWRPRD